MALDSARLAAFSVVVLLASHLATAQAHEKDRIVYVDTGGIYLSNWDGSDKKALTTGGHVDTPTWSSDGQKILYVRETPTGETYTPYVGQKPVERYVANELYIMNRDGSAPHMLRHLDGIIRQAFWSPDGKNIGLIYRPKTWDKTRPYKNGTWGINGTLTGFFTLPADGQGEPTMVLEQATEARWSPDSKKVLFAILSYPPGTGFVTHIANADGSKEMPLIDEKLFPYSADARWSPSGRQIVLSATRIHEESGSRSFATGIYIMNADGSNVQPVFVDPAWDCQVPAWAPDGKNLALFCKTMPACETVARSQGPSTDPCIMGLFTLSLDNSGAKPVKITEGSSPEVAPR